MSLKCIVVDDEPLALEMMSAYVKKTSYLESEGAFSDSLEALAFLRNNPVHLAFLDIQMPALNGLELANLLAGTETRLIFVTAYEQYALQGFKAEALDYLLKPVSYSDFLRAAERGRRWFGHASGERPLPENGLLGKNISDAGSSEYFRPDPKRADSFFVRADYRWVRIRIKDILFVESEKDYVKIHLDPQGKSRQDTPGAPFCIMTLQSMRSLEDKFSDKNFMRVHRSYLINTDQVTSVEKGRVLFADGQSVPVSDSYKAILEEHVVRRSLL